MPLSKTVVARRRKGRKGGGERVGRGEQEQDDKHLDLFIYCINYFVHKKDISEPHFSHSLAPTVYEVASNSSPSGSSEWAV